MRRLVVLLVLGVTLFAVGAPAPVAASFRSRGFEVTTDLGGSDTAFAVTFMPNGQVVAAGISHGSSVLLAYRHDGSLDPTFGDGGVVVTDFSPGTNERINDMSVQDKNRLVVVGHACEVNSERCAMFLGKYRPDGRLDFQFGRSGKRYDNRSSGEALAIQADGRLLTAGSSTDDPGSDFALVRFQSNGRLDKTFGANGLVLTDFGGTDVAADVKVQGDGKIVVAGSTDAGGKSVLALARYLPDGSLDPSFGRGGLVTTGVGYCCAHAAGVVVLPNGGLVAAGNAAQSDSGLWILVGYEPDGSIDPAFGVDGLVVSNHGGFGTALTDIAAGIGDQVVVSGWDGDEGPWAYFRVNWYDGHGTILKTEYGGFGGAPAAYAEGIATHPSGHAAAVGFTTDIYGASPDFAVADYPGP
jgi:uncharacterized delta-60 repeat protein